MTSFLSRYVATFSGFAFTADIVNFDEFDMASRGGVWVTGTDGSDFSHRQKVATHYQTSAVYKSRLKVSIFMHFLLFLVMCAKVAEDILDRLDIFILELEELYIPKPLIWEWIWISSLLFAFIGLSAVRRNRLTAMKVYAAGTFLLGFCPVVGAGIYYFNEMYEYVDSKGSSNVQLWQGYPVAVLWYIFLTLAFQAHLFSLYFSIKLVKAWQKTGKKIK